MKKDALPTSFAPRILTLMYHRVDAAETDPWGICVSVKNFEDQINFLRNNFNIISSGELIRLLKIGDIPEDAICLTFDDGYADNYTNAKPVLERYNCPATFFIPTAFIGSSLPFWWDELEIIFLHSIQLPGKLLLEIDGEEYLYTFDETRLSNKQLQQQAAWKWYEEAPTERCGIFLQIWEKLRALHLHEIKTILRFLRAWAGGTILSKAPLPMNHDQLTELSQNALFTIAMHTHTHPDLSGKELIFQTEEIAACKKILETTYNMDSNCMAYPYGRYDNNTIAAVQKLGIDACFTTAPEDIYAHSDRTVLGRHQVFNVSSTELKNQLKL